MQLINIIHIAFSHLNLKKQSYLFRKGKPDDKGRNWLTLSYSACERQCSWEHLWRNFFRVLPTQSLTTSCQIWDFLPPCWGCLLTLWLEICAPNDKFGFSGDNCLNFLQYFACTILNDFFPPNKYWRKIHLPLLFKTLWLRTNSCYSILFSNLGTGHWPRG